ncbi:TPA: hypothetical protein SI668_004649 [Escherichia coli]|nr:hypothetical protein [Escherichia coli]HEI2855568.1 hypothetical protein [Escherichia coli]HEI3493734.1 hypothetical protein [Escherichia coli]
MTSALLQVFQWVILNVCFATGRPVMQDDELSELSTQQQSDLFNKAHLTI